MIETFLFVRLGEGEVCRNVVWKLQKCYDGVGRGDVDMKLGYTFFWKKDLESLSRLSFSELRLVTNKRLGYDMPRVKLIIIIII